jgi:hypothetical protein
MKSLRSYIWRVASWTYVMDKNIALRHAASRGASNAVRVLLEAGADVHAKEDWAVRWAAKNGHTDTITVLNEWMAREVKKPAEGSETT